MENIERRLELARGGPQTQKLQKEVVAPPRRADQGAGEQAEKARRVLTERRILPQRRSARRSVGQQSVQPAETARHRDPGRPRPRRFRRSSRTWWSTGATLPPREQARALQELTQGMSAAPSRGDRELLPQPGHAPAPAVNVVDHAGHRYGLGPRGPGPFSLSGAWTGSNGTELRMNHGRVQLAAPSPRARYPCFIRASCVAVCRSRAARRGPLTADELRTLGGKTVTGKLVAHHRHGHHRSTPRQATSPTPLPQVLALDLRPAKAARPGAKLLALRLLDDTHSAAARASRFKGKDVRADAARPA